MIVHWITSLKCGLLHFCASSCYAYHKKGKMFWRLRAYRSSIRKHAPSSIITHFRIMILIVLFVSRAFILHSAFKTKLNNATITYVLRTKIPYVMTHDMWQQTTWRLAPDRRHLRLCALAFKWLFCKQTTYFSVIKVLSSFSCSYSVYDWLC